MNEQERIRESVAASYSRAIAQESACCGPKGAVAKLAGYGAEAVALAPVSQDSFGCGNPLAFSQVREGDTVLDLGSGAGLDLLIASRAVGPSGRVIGVDMTDAMIDRARQNIAREGAANVEVRRGIIEELPVESSSVDWVISNCVINLSPDKPRVFAEIARVLKPGGQMLVSDIVADDLPTWARESDAVRASCVGGALSQDEYAAGLRAAGLADIEPRTVHAYEATELAELFLSELPDSLRTTGCCGGGAIGGAARELEGKVKSVSFYARKPA